MEHEFPFGTSRPEKGLPFPDVCSSRKFSTGMTSYSSFPKEGEGVGGAGATFKILFQEGGGLVSHDFVGKLSP